MVSARKINNSMTNKIRIRIEKKFKKKNARILFMGVTFKENCADLRNSLYLKLAKKLIKNHKVQIYEPNLSNLKKICGIQNLKKIKNKYDIIIIALAHKAFEKIKIQNLNKIIKKNLIIFDLKNIYKNKNFETF